MFRCIFSARRPTPTQNGSEQPFRRHFEPGQHKNLAPARQGSGTRAPQRGVYFISHYDISDGATLGNYIASRYIRRACAPGLAGPNGRRGCGRAAKSLLFDPATTLATVRLAPSRLSADLIATRAAAKEHQLEMKKVEMLQASNPQKPATWTRRDKRATWLAYNRRVDIVLEPAGQQSAETYPDGAPEARILWARKEPSLKLMEAAAKTSVSVTEAHSNLVGK